MSLYENIKRSLKEASDGEIEKLKVELRSRIEDLSNDGEIPKLTEKDINTIANEIKKEGFFISNNIFADDDDEYEWEQINMFLDNKIRDYAEGNLKESETQAGNDLDEICSYVYDDCDGNMDNFPDKERMEYIADVNGREYNKIKKLVEKAIGNVADHLYSYDRWGKDNIELSDRATMNYIHGNFDNVDPEESMMTYEKLRDQAFKNFEDETGVEIFQDGRSGRHIVVENNYYNASHYDELCAAQEKWEDWLIDEFAKAYPETEDIN